MIISYDPGFGNIKVCILGQTAVIQSSVSRPNRLGMAGVGMKTHTCQEIELDPGGTYAVGAGSWNTGQPLGGMDWSDLVSEPRQALFFSAISMLLSPGKYDLELVVGLPVKLLQNESEANMAFAQLRGFKGAHRFMSAGDVFELSINRITPVAQPVGAYTDWLLSSDLKPRKDGKHSEVAILDIGMNTLDLYVVRDG